MYIKAIPLALVCCLFLSAQAETYDPSPSVYRFQKKMAERGDASAQFKLGTMYENGAGVDADIFKARYWYSTAADQDYKPAKNRLVYLDIKHNGFKEEHKSWLQTLKNDARHNDGEALYLLGQMYAEGTAVNKSLTRSLKLLRKAAAENISGTDSQIAKVEEELFKLQQQYLTEEDRKKLPASAVVPSKKPKPAATKASRSKNAARSSTTSAKQKPWTPVKTVSKRPTRQQASKTTSGRPVVQKARSTPPGKSTPEEIAIVKARLKAQQQSEKKNSSHPMDMICSGENRFSSGCR